MGLGAFLAGYITAGQPAMAPSTLPSTVDEERARTAAALDAVLAEAAALRAARASADVVVRAGLALRDAAASGQPFAPQIEAVRAAGSGSAPLDQALDALTPLAVGAPTWAELTARFESAVPSVLTAGQEEAAASWSSRLLAPLGWWLGRDDRTDLVDARCQTMALAQAALARGDASAAFGAIARLDPQALAALEGWTRAAQNRALLDAKTDRVVVLLTANAFESAAAN